MRVRLCEGPLAARVVWQRTRLDRVAAQSCDVLFAPGGMYLGYFRPFITMSRNMIPFDPETAAHYRGSMIGLRLRLLSTVQARTLARADGVIFLTNTARRIIEQTIGATGMRGSVIPHGISAVFRSSPREQRSIDHYSFARPFEWLYVSNIEWYKHQWTVVEAVAALRRRGLPVSLRLVGPAYGPALRKLEAIRVRHDPRGEFIHYDGVAAHAALPALYRAAHGFIFASSCENLPNTLLEAMAAGLPIACSSASVMPEVMGDAGAYFNVNSPHTIEATLLQLLRDPVARATYAQRAYQRARAFDWAETARATFAFAAERAVPALAA